MCCGRAIPAKNSLFPCQTKLHCGHKPRPNQIDCARCISVTAALLAVIDGVGAGRVTDSPTRRGPAPPKKHAASEPKRASTPPSQSCRYVCVLFNDERFAPLTFHLFQCHRHAVLLSGKCCFFSFWRTCRWWRRRLPLSCPLFRPPSKTLRNRRLQAAPQALPTSSQCPMWSGLSRSKKQQRRPWRCHPPFAAAPAAPSALTALLGKRAVATLPLALP